MSSQRLIEMPLVQRFAVSGSGLSQRLLYFGKHGVFGGAASELQHNGDSDPATGRRGEKSADVTKSSLRDDQNKQSCCIWNLGLWLAEIGRKLQWVGLYLKGYNTS